MTSVVASINGASAAIELPTFSKQSQEFFCLKLFFSVQVNARLTRALEKLLAASHSPFENGQRNVVLGTMAGRGKRREEGAETVFEVQLVRKGDSTVVYMECDHDLVAHLSAALHLPVGAIAREMSEVGPDLGIVKFGGSIANLRDAVWHGNKASMLPGNCPPSTTTVKVQRLQTPAVPDCLCGTGVFNPVQHQHWSNCRLCQKVDQAQYGGGGYPGYHTQEMVQVCSKCGSCDECTTKIYQGARKGVKLVDDRSALARVEKSTSLPKFEKTVKFLVDNSLCVFENSSVKALQLLSASQVNIADIQTEARQVTTSEARLLLAHLMFNSSTILSDVFPQ